MGIQLINEKENLNDFSNTPKTKNRKHKLVLVTGIFDVLHPGHIRLLKFAKNCGDVLLVGIFGDGTQKDIRNSQDARKESLEALNFVSDVKIISSDLTKEILTIKPDIIVKGKEHQGNYNEEEEIIKNLGGELIFSSGEIGFTNNLITENKRNSHGNYLDNCDEFLRRHSIQKDSLISIINNFSNKKVCVLGDLIVDEYIECFPLGMSQEEPIIALKPLSSKKYIGGAGIVASHANSLGAEVLFYSVVGEDENRDFAANFLADGDVDFNFIIDKNRQTSLKKRYRCNDRTLFKVSELTQQSISKEYQNALLNKLKSIIPKIDILIFSDFNYGFLPHDLVSELIELGESNNVFMAADSQSSSQTGDLSKFKNMDLITPTEQEARITLRNNEDGLVVIANKLLDITNSKNILLTMGPDGFLAHNPSLKRIITEQVPALNNNPVNISGAGDSLLITTSLALCSGASLWEASIIGALAASMQVSRVGNIPLTKAEIIREIEY